MKRLFLIASAIAGLLLASSWIGGAGLFLFVAFVPLLLVDTYMASQSGTNSSQYWIYAFLTAFIWNLLATWWIWNATPAGASFAILINSLLMSLVLWMVHETRKIKGNAYANFFFVFAWLSFEYMHYNWDMEWPWLNLGNGFANSIKMVQWYEYSGVMGGSFWVLLSNIFIANSIRYFYTENKKSGIRYMVLSALLLLLPLLLSLQIFKKYAEESHPVQVVISQPNIDPYQTKFDQSTFKQQYQTMLDHMLQYDSVAVDLFILPETALHNIWLGNPEDNFAIRRFKSFLKSRNDNAALVAGAMTYQLYPNSEEASRTARLMNDSTFLYDAYNSALLITKSGIEASYHKNKLVSGVEKMPFAKMLRFLEKLVVDLGGTSGTLGTIDDKSGMSVGKMHFAVPICYESVFGEYVNGFVQNGAEFLCVITNDGWWKNTPGYRQHFAFSRLLAIETRRSIARAGNTGISGFINQKGEVIKQSEWWSSEVVKGTVNRNKKLTFYVQHGDYIGRIGVFIFVLMGLGTIVQRIKSKKKPHYPVV